MVFNSLHKLACKVVLGSGFEVYVGGTMVASGSGWTGGGTTVTKLRLGCANNSNGSVFSEIMVADYDIRDSRFMVAALNGNSAANTGAASGVYTDVNETVLDESTNISITTSGNKAGQTHAAITVPAGYIIAAAVISARGRVSGSITDGKLGVRSGGTNASSAGRGYNGGYEPRQTIVDNDPSTATRFTQSGFNAAETYLEAA
jgi:hypothetical protein